MTCSRWAGMWRRWFFCPKDKEDDYVEVKLERIITRKNPKIVSGGEEKSGKRCFGGFWDGVEVIV